MTTPTTINLQIDRFCNCEGCIQKVKTTFRELGGVKLLAMDPDNGKFTVLTAKHPEIVQFALHKKLKKNVTIQLETSPLSSSLPAFNNPRNLITPSSRVTTQGNDVHDMANSLVTISHAKGLQSVEYTQSNTFKFKFANTENYWPSTSGSPPTSHNIRGSNGVYNPLPPPPPSTIEPSAPLIPTSQYQVYGYPSEFYGFPKSSTNDYDPQDCCTII